MRDRIDPMQQHDGKSQTEPRVDFRDTALYARIKDRPDVQAIMAEIDALPKARKKDHT